MVEGSPSPAMNSRDGKNRPVQAWVPVGEPRAASWHRASSNEWLAAAQISAQVTDVFEIRWTDDLNFTDPKDRLVYDGSVYDVVEEPEIGRREGLLIRANAHVDSSAP